MTRSMATLLLPFASLASIASAGCVFDGNAPGTRDATASGEVFVSPAAEPSGEPPSFRPGAKRYVVFGRRSHLDVSGHDTVLGDHRLTFRSWSARIETEPPRIVVDIDLRSLDSSEGMIVPIVRDNMLEADRYPHATLVGSLSAAGRAGEIVIDGIADVHGKRVPLRFTGAMHEEGKGYRFRGSFDMSRRAFDVSFAPVEPFLDDTFRVSVDAVAIEERVDVEEGG